VGFGWHLDLHDTGELAGEVGHVTFQPVGLVVRHHLGELADDARAIGSDDADDECLVHGLLFAASRR